MKHLPTLAEIAEAELAISKGSAIEPALISERDIIVYEASRNDMMSRVDHILDRHIDDVEKGDSIENMLIEAAKEFMMQSGMEKNNPVRNMQFLQIEYKDYLLTPNTIMLDRDRCIKPMMLTQKRYTKEFTFNTLNQTRIGSIMVYGEILSGYDKGFVNSFAEKLNTAILSFNRRKYHLEEKAILHCLNSIMANDSISIEERRQKMIDEIVARTKSKEGYVVLVKDGRKPTIDSIAEDDLEIRESSGKDVLDEEKIRYILEKAVYVIKTPEEVDIFNDAKDKLGYCLATELKINETGKIGGAFVLFDENEFLNSRQTMAEAAGLKIDDYIILNKEIKEERDLRMKIEEVLKPMVDKDLADYLIKEHDFRKFAMPQPRFVVISLSDMKGSTDIADSLIVERLKLGKDSQEMREKYQRYVDTVNSYLGLVTEADLSFEGVIDKYIGDAVMAVWGIPIEAENVREIARRALLASVFANILTVKHNRKMEREGVDPKWILQQRFVLHCGDVLAGIYGTKLRHNYTIMGAPANETARIEGLPVTETGKVTMSHDFYSLVDDVANVEYAGEFSLKGKKEPVKIYHFKEFNVKDFKAFASQCADLGRRFSRFEKSTFFNDFINGMYNSETYLNQW